MRHKTSMGMKPPCRSNLWLPFMILLAGCPASTQGAGDADTCATCGAAADASSPQPAELFSHEFPMQTVAAGMEITGMCRSWTLHNEHELWVNSVEFKQDESSHHADFVFVPDDKFSGEDGIWPCADRKYDFFSAIAAGGVLYAQSTQAGHEVQSFAPGVAFKLPKHARIISDIHLLNVTDAAITGHVHLEIQTLASDEVKVALQSFHMEYDAINVPPHQSARYTAHCDVASDYKKVTGKTFSPRLYFLMPHTHATSTHFFANVLGGSHDGESLLDLGAFDSAARGHQFTPPIDLGAAQGFVFGCEYTNPYDQPILWGTGKNEMCELFGFADIPSFFQSRVSTGSPAGMDGDVPMFTGNCNNDVYPLR